MIPTDFPETNIRFVAPKDVDPSQVLTIPGYNGEVKGGTLDGCRICVVAWTPTNEERIQLMTGAPIFLSFIGGIPPHFPSLSFQEAIQPG